MRLRIMLGLVLVVLLAGCGGGASSSPTTDSPSPSVVKPLTADAVVDALKAAGLPIGERMVYTAETDVNELLGRPGQYTGKVNFRDTRIEPESGGNFDVGDGGAVEVFAALPDAAQRLAYVSALAQGSPLFLEYDYQHGMILLRLSHRLTPEQAAEYETALKALPTK